jgi:hypothetical protein
MGYVGFREEIMPFMYRSSYMYRALMIRNYRAFCNYVSEKKSLTVTNISQLLCPLAVKQRLRFNASNKIEVKDL